MNYFPPFEDLFWRIGKNCWNKNILLLKNKTYWCIWSHEWAEREWDGPWGGAGSRIGVHPLWNLSTEATRRTCEKFN